MPGIIGQEAKILAGYSEIPEVFQKAMQAGVPFFELRTAKAIQFTSQINGPFSVSATSDYDEQRGRSNFYVDWLTGDFARIRFEVTDPKSGLAVAYMPDDPWWHNRMMAGFNRELRNIHAYHTKDGMYPGKQAVEEIDILYRALTVESMEYTVRNALGNSTGSFKEKKDAEEEISKHGYRNHTVQARSIRVNSRVVEEMIRNWRTMHRSRYGWTDCPEFKTIQKRVIDEIKSYRGLQTSAQGPLGMTREQVGLALIQAVRGMTVDERTTLAKEISKNTESQVREKVFEGVSPEKLSIQELRQKAKAQGIAVTPKMKRPELIELLRRRGETLIDKEAGKIAEEIHEAPPQPEEPEEPEIVK